MICACGAALPVTGSATECKPCRAGRLAAAGIRARQVEVEDLGEVVVDSRMPTPKKLREVLRMAKAGGYQDDQCVAVPIAQLGELLDALDEAIKQPNQGETP